jgi:cytochrome b involved in lipid metabolism
MDKLFDLVLGLPVHPLIIHVVVVFLPLFSLALIALFIFKPLREKYGLIVQIGLGIAFVSSFIAEQSGEALSLRVGTPIKHADLGEKLVPLAFVLSLIWFYLQRNSTKFKDLFINIFGIISVVLAIASIVMTYLVGHSGAEASWKERIAPKKVTQENTTQNSTSESNSPIVLNIEEVSKHNNPNDCWTVINNEVYNLTSYLKSHPGGEPNILRLCGIDGSSLFASQHGNEGSPNRQLSNLVIGNLGETIAEIPTMTAQNMDKQNKQENEGDND